MGPWEGKRLEKRLRELDVGRWDPLRSGTDSAWNGELAAEC